MASTVESSSEAFSKVKGRILILGRLTSSGELGFGHSIFTRDSFPGMLLAGILQPVKNAVVDLLHDVIDGGGRAGILETTAATIAGRGGKQSAVGGEDVEAQKYEFLDKRNQSMKDLLISGFSNATVEEGEGGLAREAIIANAGETAEVLAADGWRRISKKSLRDRILSR